jgi:hypothetical protein
MVSKGAGKGSGRTVLILASGQEFTEVRHGKLTGTRAERLAQRFGISPEVVSSSVFHIKHQR